MRYSLKDCLACGVHCAKGFCVVAALGAIVVTVVFLLQRGSSQIHADPGAVLIGIITIAGSYFAAGALASIAFYFMQHMAGPYIGDVAIAFVLGGIIYGTVGLSGTLAYVFFGLNLFDVPSVTEAWRMLPGMTLTAACFTAVLYPLLSRAKRS
jgi:hypothetical protein